MNTWDTDRQYEEHRITKVEDGEIGWSLYFDGMGILCPGDLCEQAPAIGETARLYGKGFGYLVRGIIIEGRVYRYLTEEGQEEERARQVEQAKQGRAKQLESERADRDARRAALPEVFQRRLNGYEARNPEWRAEFEPYELSVCEDAVAVAKHCGSEGELARFNGLSWEEQKAAIPSLFDGHSGNSWNAAMGLAGRYMQNPEYVMGAHGALCGLVGCEGYGCPGADLKKEKSDV